MSQRTSTPQFTPGARRSIALRHLFALLIVLLGVIATALFLRNSTLYQALAEQQQEQSLAEILRLKTADILERSVEYAVNLGWQLQHDEPQLQDAARTGEAAGIQGAMDRAFHQYFTTSGLLRLEKIVVYDAQFALIGASAAGMPVAPGEELCPELAQRANSRAGSARLKAIHSLCAYQDKPLLAVMVSIGGLRPLGYLVVVLDPLWNLQALEANLGTPVRFLSATGQPLYVSAQWPEQAAAQSSAIAHYDVAAAGKTVFAVEASVDLSAFHGNLQRLRGETLFGAIAVLMTTLVIALVVLARAMRNIDKLRSTADAVAAGHYRAIDTPVYAELQPLKQAFNQMVAQVRDHTDHLEELVAARTAELEAARLKLQEDFDRQKEIERLKDEFVAMINHEMRTPVAAIRGALALLLGGASGSLPDQCSTLVGLAKRNCDRLLRLVNDVLDLQHLAEGSISLRATPTALAPLLRAAASANAEFATERNVAQRVNIADESTVAMVDPDRVSQVLSHLLSNAAKFTHPDDTIEICLTTQAERAVITVSDNGPGIPDSFRPRLFARFAQVDSSNTRATGSAGLGLYISRKLVEAMKGTIRCQSEEGHGASFIVELPLHATTTSA